MVIGRFKECAKYMSSEAIGRFLDGAIRNRIAVRLIAEQHIVLSRALHNPEQANATDVGIVNMALSPVEMIRMCASFVSELCEATLGAAPQVVIDGATDATFAYVLGFSPVPLFPPFYGPTTQTDSAIIFFLVKIKI